MAYLKPGDEPPTKGRGSKLSGKMLRFVDEYMIDLVGKDAILRAGYKTKNPDNMAAELLHHPLVSREIQKRTEERRERSELSAEYVVQKLISIVEETEKDNPNAALRGLESLGRHLGMFRDRQEISGPDGEAIKYEQKVNQTANEFTDKIKELGKRSTDNVVPFQDKSKKEA